MGEKVNLNVHTQRRAYIKGMQDGFTLLITVLEETGSISHMMDVLEDNCNPENRARIEAYYGSKK
jgi:hypothetical protein